MPSNIFLFSYRNSSITILGHNLTTGEAYRKTVELRKEGLPAFFLQQEKFHHCTSPENCDYCSDEIGQHIKIIGGANAS